MGPMRRSWGFGGVYAFFTNGFALGTMPQPRHLNTQQGPSTQREQAELWGWECLCLDGDDEVPAARVGWVLSSMWGSFGDTGFILALLFADTDLSIGVIGWGSGKAKAMGCDEVEPSFLTGCMKRRRKGCEPCRCQHHSHLPRNVPWCNRARVALSL